MVTLNYLIRRILQALPVLFIATIIIFFMIRLIPGDPVTVLLGEKATPKMVELLTEKMGLNKPIPVQYFIYLKNIFKFDFGDSIHYRIPVFELIGKKFKVTVVLIAFSVLFSIFLSLLLGYISGIKKDKLQDQIIRTTSLMALSMPQFWVGLLLMFLFSVKIKLFPVGGWGNTWPEHIRSIILPAFTQALMTIALLTRNLRSSVINIQKLDYVYFARSKGVEENVVKKRHIIRNALIPYVTLLSMQMAFMFSGSIIVETVFALPGIGALMVTSVYNRDYIVIQAVVLIFALMVTSLNILTDLFYVYLDPRVRLS